MKKREYVQDLRLTNVDARLMAGLRMEVARRQTTIRDFVLSLIMKAVAEAPGSLIDIPEKP